MEAKKNGGKKTKYIYLLGLGFQNFLIFIIIDVGEQRRPAEEIPEAEERVPLQEELRREGARMVRKEAQDSTSSSR